MPNVNVQFNGATLVLPGAYYADNVSNALVPTQSLTPPLVFIGNFYGLKPKTATTFTSAQDAVNAMRGAPASSFIPFMSSPSPSLSGAQFITLINAAENTQATSLISSTGGASGLVNLTSVNYGSSANTIQYTIEAGSAFEGATGYIVTILDGYTNTSISGDNIGIAFSIAYTGSGIFGACVITGSVTTGASVLTISSSNADETFVIPLGPSGYSTIADVVEYINGTGFFIANILNSQVSNEPSQDLVVGTSIPLPPPPSPGNYEFGQVSTGPAGLAYWFNQYANSLVTATLASSAVPYAAYTLTISTAVNFLSGGQNVPPTNTDYATAFNVALNTPGWAVFADSNSTAVMALGAQHAETASSTLYGAWRRFVTGSNIGDSVSTSVTNATDLDSNTTTYCYPGIYRTDTTTGANTLYGGLYVAASVAGIMCGNIIAQPLTNQVLTGNGIEQAGGANQFLSTSQINTLQNAGVLVLNYPSTNVPTIVSDLTTWQVDNNPENVFNQQIACRWGLAYSLTAAVQPYIGTIASPYGITRIRNAVVQQLNNLVYSAGNNGVLSSWDSSSLVLKYTGATQSLSVTVNVVLVGQIRFIFMQTFVFPLNLTSTTSTSTSSAVTTS